MPLGITFDSLPTIVALGIIVAGIAIFVTSTKRKYTALEHAETGVGATGMKYILLIVIVSLISFWLYLSSGDTRHWFILAGWMFGLVWVYISGLWGWTTFTEKILFSLFSVVVVLLLMYGGGPGFIALGLTLLFMFVSGKAAATPDPPTILVPSVWNRRETVIINERRSWAFDYFPLSQDYTPLVVESQNLDLVLTGVRTLEHEEEDEEQEHTHATAPTVQATAEARRPHKAGGEVTVKVSLTYNVDYSTPGRPNQYINAGKQPGVKTILSDVMGEATRQFATELTWEELTFLQEHLSVELIERVTGVQPTQKALLVNGKPLRNLDPKKPKYEVDPNPRLPDEPLNKWDIELFLDYIQKNGANDVRNLGIVITRLNVTEVVPEGELRHEAEKLAIEKQQRRAELRDAKTETRVAEWYKTKYPNLSDAEALKLARLVRKRSSREIIITGNTRDAMAAGILSQQDEDGGP